MKMKVKKSQGKKFIATAAVAVTATGLSIVNATPVMAANRPKNVLNRTAEILGVPSGTLLDALKQAQVENIEYQIQAGQVDPARGIKMIHSLDDANEESLKLNATERKAIKNERQDVLKHLKVSKPEFKRLMQTGYSLSEIAEMKGVERTEIKEFVKNYHIKSINENRKLDGNEKQSLIRKLDKIVEDIVDFRL